MEKKNAKQIAHGQILAGAVTCEKIAVGTWTTLPDGRVYYNGDLGNDIKHFRSYEKIAAFRKIPLSIIHDLVKKWAPSTHDLNDVIRFDLKCDKVRSNEEMFEQAEMIKHMTVDLPILELNTKEDDV